MDYRYLFTDFDGRIGRQAFWIGAVILFGAQIVNGFLFGNGFIGGVIAVALLYPQFAVLVKRFHDRGKTGWWSLIIFVPVVGFFWILIDCGILKGTEGPNAYGPDPLTGAAAP